MARPRSAAAREKTLDAATELLLASGVRGFNVDEVARRSGVAKTTIYRHFGSRSELLVAAIDRFTPIPPTPDTGSLRGDIVEFLDGVRPIFANDDLRALSFEIFAESRREPDLQAAYMGMMQRRAGPTMAIYNHGLERGEIAPDIDYRAALEIIEGPFIVRSILRASTLYDMDIEVLADRMVTALGSGGKPMTAGRPVSTDRDPPESAVDPVSEAVSSATSEHGALGWSRPTVSGEAGFDLGREEIECS